MSRIVSQGRLIGLGGWKGSGKDQFADYLVDAGIVVKLGMSDRLLDAAYVLNPRIQVNRVTAIELGFQQRSSDIFLMHNRLTDIVDAIGWTQAKRIVEVRTFLQRLGTDVGRRMIGENVWVDERRTTISELLDSSTNVALTGVRFPNELKMIRDLGGTAIWVNRPSAKPPVDEHESERALTAEDFDQVIDNSGTLFDLEHAARRWSTDWIGAGK